MLTENELQSIAERAIKMCDGVDAEILLSSSDSALTRFSENTITQNVASQGLGLTVRLIKDGRTGKAETGYVTDEGIRNCIDTAKAVLKVTNPDPEVLPLVGKQSYKKQETFAAATVDASPELRADGVVKAIELFKKDGLAGAGIFSSGGSASYQANNAGMRAHYATSDASFSISAMSGDSSGWAESFDHEIGKIDVLKVAEIAAKKALAGKQPASVEPGAWTVVLEPAAVSDILMFMAWEPFNGLALAEERSCFSGKIGQKVVGENITITDDCYHPLSIGMPFDFEGSPRKRVPLIENGVFRGTVHDRRTAKKCGVEDTGHSLPQPNAWGPVPGNMIVSAGNSNLVEMIASTKHGLLVTRFHYCNLLNPMTMSITGMTRDGLFLIENGKVTKGVKNLRFTESILHALANVESLSKELYRTETFWGGGGTVVPAMKINDFHFTSKTEN